MYIYIYIYIYTYKYIIFFFPFLPFICTYIYRHIYMYIQINMYVYIYIYRHKYICVCICIYIYIFICICTRHDCQTRYSLSMLLRAEPSTTSEVSSRSQTNPLNWQRPRLHMHRRHNHDRSDKQAMCWEVGRGGAPWPPQLSPDVRSRRVDKFSKVQVPQDRMDSNIALASG